jgi:hypothetical protein
MKLFPDFKSAIAQAEERLAFQSHTVEPGRWQGVDMSRKPEAAMKEVLNHSFQVSMGWREGLSSWAEDIGPNLPWADRHFEEERVSGHPINPGETWKIWPYGHSADKFRDQRGQYNHSYAERYWPRFAGAFEDGKLPPGSLGTLDQPFASIQGIRYRYGDLNDLVNQLATDPYSRQAYLPVWFPEDGSHNDRKPCTLGYHFIQRNGHFHCVYYIRSCDFVRHFRDDCYLTVRLMLWILDRLREKDERWKSVKVGIYTMHVTSLHCFINDWHNLRAKLVTNS